MDLDLEHLIPPSDACQRLGWGSRRLARILDQLGAVEIAGRTFVDRRLVDQVAAAQPDLSGLLTAREAARLGRTSLGNLAKHADQLQPITIDGPTGPQKRYPVANIIAFAREREAVRPAADAKRAASANAKRDRQP